MLTLASTATPRPDAILTPFLPDGLSPLALFAGFLVGLWLACTVLTAAGAALVGLLVTGIRELIASRAGRSRRRATVDEHNQQRALQPGEPTRLVLDLDPSQTQQHPPETLSAAESGGRDEATAGPK